MLVIHMLREGGERGMHVAQRLELSGIKEGCLETVGASRNCRCLTFFEVSHFVVCYITNFPSEDIVE